jgi:hypothetical protein
MVGGYWLTLTFMRIHQGIRVPGFFCDILPIDHKSKLLLLLLLLFVFDLNVSMYR